MTAVFVLLVESPNRTHVTVVAVPGLVDAATLPIVEIESACAFIFGSVLGRRPVP